MSLLYLYLHLFDPFSISLSFYYRKVVNGIGETVRGEPDRGVNKREELWVSFAPT